MPNDDATIVKDLRAAITGLLYPSETDTGFDIFNWNTSELDPAAELATHIKPGRKIQEISIEQFFEELKDSDDAEGFAQVKQIVQTSLIGLKIMRVGAGEVEVDVYLIGKTPAGNWAGLHTVSVET